MGERLTVAELRDRVEASSRRVAELSRRADELEARLKSARLDADRAERNLAAARRGRKGFFELARSHLDGFFEFLPWLPAAVPVVVIAAVIVGTCGEEEADPEFLFEAMGSAIEVQDGGGSVLLGQRCEVALRKADVDGVCAATVTCGEPIFDADVGCTIDERSESDGEDTRYWDALVVTGLDLDRFFGMDTDEAGAELVTPSGARVRLALHELGWEGEL